jgi:phosphoribosyl 1,2-cyclic phosphate phosphodiesterase
MNLTLLGTGTSQGVPVVTCECPVCTSDDPRDKRLRTSALIQSSETSIVIDAGPDFRAQMLAASVKRLDAVLLTHDHHDHVSGLDDVRAFNFSQKMSMPVYGNSQCLFSVKRHFEYAFGEHKYPGVPEFRLIEMPDGPFQIGEFEILPVHVYHGKLLIVGFRIGRLAYITDASCIPDASLEMLFNLDVLVINALRHKPHHSHFSIAEAIEVIHNVRPKKAFLTHISHVAGKHSDLMKELPANVQPAFDGLKIQV